jgi:predicted DCC family thiol-disulfide oxidoreductase YuxK
MVKRLIIVISIYDSRCTACNAFRRWIERRDPAQKVRFIDNQNDESLRLLGDLPVATREGTIFFISGDGRRYQGAKAIFLIISRTEGVFGFICKCLAVWPTYVVFEPIYGLFARHRGKFAWLFKNCQQ